MWQHSQPLVLHAVQLTADSLFGVPFHVSVPCDSCRIALPRSAIDSLRLGDKETPSLLAIELPLAFLLFILTLVRGT